MVKRLEEFEGLSDLDGWWKRALLKLNPDGFSELVSVDLRIKTQNADRSRVRSSQA
jgi:hypothetical protein